MSALFVSPARIYLGIALFFQGYAAILAQNYPSQVEYDFRRISMQDGLANQIITFAREDANGLLWIGTQLGLYYFDGFRVTRFQPNPKGQFPNEFFTDLEPISTPEADYLFICSQFGSRLIDAANQRFVSFETIGLSDSLLLRCTQIEKKEPGKYIALCHKGIYLLEQTTDGNFSSQFISDIPFFKSQKMVLDPHDPESIWVLPQQQQVYRVHQRERARYAIPGVPGNPAPIAGLLGLVHTPLGLVGWDHVRNLFRFNPLDDRFETITTGLTLVDLFPALGVLDQKFKQRNILHSYTALQTGQDAIGTTLGLFICQKRPNHFRVPEAVAGSEVRGIWTDSLGNWMAGTYTGLFRGSLRHNVVQRIANLRGVWAFLHLSDDTWMLACENLKGIHLWNSQTDAISAPNPWSSYQKPPLSALSLCRDALGNIWVGTYSNLHWSPPDSPFVFRPFFGSVQYPFLQPAYFRALFPDRDSSIWVGAETGLFRIDLRNHPNHIQIDTLLNQSFISDIYHDRFDHIWIATKGKGVARYDRDSRQFEWFDTERGLTNNYTCRIEGSDNDNVLWISTHDGLSRLDVPSGVFHHYREEDGIPGNEFNSGASAKSGDGTLLFGGVSGLVSFHPDSLRPGNFRYKTIVSHIHYHDKDTDSLHTLNIHDEPIVLPPYPRIVEICLGINDYIRGNQVRFRYRLLDASSSWVYTSGDNKIRFFQLAPGDYVFEAQAFPPNGHHSAVVRFQIQIRTPYYETWWFRMLLLFSIILISYFAYWYQMQQFIQTNAIRQQIADDLHDDIGNKLNLIGILIQKIKTNQQENSNLSIKEILNKILDINRDTLLSLRTLIWSVDPKKDNLHNLFARMQDFADDYLLPLNVQCQFSLPPSIPNNEIRMDIRHNLIMIYQELLTNMIKHAPPKQLNIRLNLSENDALTLTLTNTFRHLDQENFSTTSGNLGLDILQRRLDKIGGTIELIETNETFQKTILSFPRVFR